MLSTTLPADFEFAFDEYLYNTERHRQSQVSSGWSSFYWLDSKKKRVTASWHIHIENGESASPYRATFGGPQFDSSLALRDISAFIATVVDFLITKGVESLRTVLPPQGYNDRNFIKLYQALSDFDFSPIKSEVVSILPVKKNAFESTIHTSERKKLKRSVKQGLEFKKVSEKEYEKIYDLIQSCRQERGHSLSLSKDDLKRIIDLQADRFKYYQVSDMNSLVAAAICIHVSDTILYVFYGGHLKAYDNISPAVMLYQGIYKDCQQESIRMLDFGTSPDEVGTNYDLLDFKRYLGSELSLKITFQKEL